MGNQFSTTGQSEQKEETGETAEFDITTRSAALTFNYGHCYQHLTPALIEELKRIHSIPWPIILNDQV